MMGKSMMAMEQHSEEIFSKDIDVDNLPKGICGVRSAIEGGPRRRTHQINPFSIQIPILQI
jgi:hypothetical protein